MMLEHYHAREDRMASGYEKDECGAEPGGLWGTPGRLASAIWTGVAVAFTAAHVLAQGWAVLRLLVPGL